MTRFEEMTLSEQVLLLGFLPVLGATGQFGTSLVAAFIGAAAAVAVGFAARLVPGRYGETVRWAVLLAIGFGLSSVLTVLAVYLIPVPERARMYLFLIGATPLVYAGGGTLYPGRKVIRLLPRYVIIVTGFGLVREVLGSGSLFGAGILPDGIVPVGILSSSAGALLLFASLALFSHLRAHSHETPDADSPRQDNPIRDGGADHGREGAR